MSWNMPDGATTDQYDRYCGYLDGPDEDDYEEPEPEEDDQPEVISEEAAMEALREEAGDRAYEQQEEDRLFPLGPLTVGPFEPEAPHMTPVAEGLQQGKLFKEVA